MDPHAAWNSPANGTNVVGDMSAEDIDDVEEARVQAAQAGTDRSTAAPKTTGKTAKSSVRDSARIARRRRLSAEIQDKKDRRGNARR